MSIRLKSAFERFRKRIGRLPFPDSLEAIHDQFGELSANDFFLSGKPWVHAEQLAALTKYIVLFGANKSRRPFVDFAPAWNAYKHFWKYSEEASLYSADEAFVAIFILRMVYQQITFLLYQQRLPQLIARTERIVSGESQVRRTVENLAGIPLDILLNTARELHSIFLHHAALSISSLRTLMPQSFQPHLDTFLSFQGGTRNEFRVLHAQTKASVLAEKPYEFNPLLRFPLLRYGNSVSAPFPELIIYGATRGLFFRLADIGKAQDFGRAYEHYACELVSGGVGRNRVLTEAEERALGWEGKTNDFTVIEGGTAVLFECKNSGLFSESKRLASVEAVLCDVRKNIVNSEDRSGLFQLYDKIEAIRSNRLPRPLAERYKGVQQFLPILLLYDQIQHANADRVLGNLLRSELRKHGIEDFSFQIWHIEEVEDLLSLVSSSRFVHTVREKFHARYRQWDLDTYLYETTKIRHLRPFMFVPPSRTQAEEILRSIADSEP